jgi:hypothetical protein
MERGLDLLELHTHWLIAMVVVALEAVEQVLRLEL